MEEGSEWQRRVNYLGRGDGAPSALVPNPTLMDTYPGSLSTLSDLLRGGPQPPSHLRNQLLALHPQNRQPKGHRNWIRHVFYHFHQFWYASAPQGLRATQDRGAVFQELLFLHGGMWASERS